MSSVGEYGCRTARGVAPVSTGINRTLSATSLSSLLILVPSLTTRCEAFETMGDSASRRRSWCAGNSFSLSRVCCVIDMRVCASEDGIGASIATRRGKTGLHIWAVLVGTLGWKRTNTRLALSPVRHLLQWQLCPVDSCCLQPYRQSKEDNHDPKGEDREPTQPYAFCRFRRR